MTGRCSLVLPALLLLLVAGTLSALVDAAEEADFTFAIRMRIRKGGKVRKGGKCTLRERDLILQAVKETVKSYHGDEVSKTDVDPWWCHSLCQAYGSEYCTVFHEDCPHPDDLMSIAPAENEIRHLANNRLVQIYEVDRQAHPSSPEKRRRLQKQAIKTKCHAAKVSVLTRVRDELGQGVSKICISFLKYRMDLSCFIVNQADQEQSLTAGTFEEEPFEEEEEAEEEHI